MTVELQLPSTQTVISTAASVAATAMLLRTLARDYLPRELRHYLHSKLTKTLTSFFFSSQLTVIIDEFEALSHNELFNAVELYLKPHTTPNTKRFKATMPPKENKISVTMERNEETLDTFNGVVFCWKLISKHIPSRYIQTPGSSNEYHSPKSETRHFELRFHKKHRDMAVAEYFPHVMEKAKGVNEERKTLKLFTLRSERFGGRNREKMWHSASLDHPATFDTLAMDWELKRMVMEDLDRFLGRKGLYKSVGKAWKRGYLLSGPPGTGKASLVAAMANYLNFDVYDLELTDLRCLGKNNFIDGLWSSCGDERIIVFTTNHKDKLDPALLRPGRMDVHIAMSYCTPCGFKMQASNYLGITEHPLFVEVDKLLQTTNVTPAEVGEHFLKNEEPEIALRSLIELLVEKGRNHESKAIKADLTIE